VKTVLLIAHGSRLESSNREVEQLAAELAEHSDFDSVECAFLELAQPDIPSGVERCIKAGADSIVVVPYFLAAGTHVQEDIPQAIAEAQARYPECDMQITPHIGAATMMSELVQQIAK
jgi:sirohydrochlorin ferrochelatase